MTNFIPIFPLGIVLYPGEELNLHIFEPKYKQLIRESFDNKKPFGIPAVVDNKMQDYGTSAEIVSIEKVYDNGEMDIRTIGRDVFRILEVIREIPDKLFCGAIVNYPQNSISGIPKLMQKIIESIHELHRLLKVKKNFSRPDHELKSYDIAHHIGLTLHEEYELLGLMKEKQRQEYIKRHLARVIPLVAEMEVLKEKIKMNGHFKNLEGFNLNV